MGGLFDDRPGEDGLPQDAAAFHRIGHRAIWSDDKRHRFILWRDWGPQPLRNFVQIIGLNPSTADETENDPTLRRVITFAKRMGYGGLVMTNLFSYRSTDPEALYDLPDADLLPPANDEFLRDVARYARRVIAAWGTHGNYKGRGEQVAEMLANDGVPLLCLGNDKDQGRNKDRTPKHPLYLPGDAELWPYP